jgi:hypothetical protein
MSEELNELFSTLVLFINFNNGNGYIPLNQLDLKTDPLKYSLVCFLSKFFLCILIL